MFLRRRPTRTRFRTPPTCTRGFPAGPPRMAARWPATDRSTARREQLFCSAASYESSSMKKRAAPAGARPTQHPRARHDIRSLLAKWRVAAVAVAEDFLASPASFGTPSRSRRTGCFLGRRSLSSCCSTPVASARRPRPKSRGRTKRRYRCPAGAPGANTATASSGTAELRQRPEVSGLPVEDVDLVGAGRSRAEARPSSLLRRERNALRARRRIWAPRGSPGGAPAKEARPKRSPIIICPPIPD